MAEAATIMKRPHLDAFLAAVYPYYDLVVSEPRGGREGGREGHIDALFAAVYPYYDLVVSLVKGREGRREGGIGGACSIEISLTYIYAHMSSIGVESDVVAVAGNQNGECQKRKTGKSE